MDVKSEQDTHGFKYKSLTGCPDLLDRFQETQGPLHQQKVSSNQSSSHLVRHSGSFANQSRGSNRTIFLDILVILSSLFSFSWWQVVVQGWLSQLQGRIHRSNHNLTIRCRRSLLSSRSHVILDILNLRPSIRLDWLKGDPSRSRDLLWRLLDDGEVLLQFVKSMADQRISVVDWREKAVNKLLIIVNDNHVRLRQIRVIKKKPLSCMQSRKRINKFRETRYAVDSTESMTVKQVVKITT